MQSAQPAVARRGETMRTSTTAAAAFLSLAFLAQAFVPSLAPPRGLGHTRASRCRPSVSCRMSLQTPPSQKKPAVGAASGEVEKEKGADGLEAAKAEAAPSPGNGGSKKRALGIKEPEEQDVMWKLKVRWRSLGRRG